MRFTKENSKYYYDNIQLTEGAYFFRSVGTLTKRNIDDLFKSVEKDSSVLAREEKNNETMDDGTIVKCSLLLFNKTIISDILPNPDNQHALQEKRVGYLVVIEIENYIVVVKKNVSGISSWLNSLAFIGGTELTSAMASNKSTINQVKLTNMSMNPDSLRNRSYEGNDLANSMPLYGLNRNILKIARFETNGEKTSISLGTARINQFGKKNIHDLCQWAYNIVQRINNPNNLAGTLFDSFAQTVSWKSKKDKIIPASLLINVHSLTNYRQIQGLRLIYKVDNGGSLSSLFDRIIDRINTCFELNALSADEYECMNSHGTLMVKTSSSGIYLKSKGRLADLFVVDIEGNKNRLTTFISSNKCFTVGFQQPEYIYYGHQLHEDRKLLNNLDAILTVFEPIDEMNGVTSEKGNIHNGQNEFDKDSVFYAVEHHFIGVNASHIICDDLGNEWADHLITKGDTLYFVHSKAKRGHTSLSASNFQDVIAQALKNIGNMNSDTIDSKRDRFLGNYSTTKKPQCRCGTVDGFISEYKRLNQSPNGRQEVCLAVNFVSKRELENAFHDVNYVRTHNTVVQLIWLLYSFISSCKDAGMGCRIFCKN